MTNNKFTLGCDPGVKGALALLQGDAHQIIEIWDTPSTHKLSGKGNQVSAQLLNLIVGEAKALCEGHGSYTLDAVIEQVSAFGMGKTSAFGFGRSVGVLEGVIAAHNIPIYFITPQKWKKQHGLLKKDKDAARTLCLAKHPDHIDYFKLKKHCDRADAVLIGSSEY